MPAGPFRCACGARLPAYGGECGACGSPVPTELTTRTAPRLEGQGQRPLRSLGPYNIVDVLGQGGMGTVYLAQQTTPIRRQVALKVITEGTSRHDVVRRFEAERQALALMDHPHIATVFDAGTSEDGSPYFAMEYVQGVPISRYCETHRMSTNERLRLFGQVCAAVHHAHQKGIIHRDLKPSNILVELQDGQPTPKVIDFGIAKAAQNSIADATLTLPGVLIGTPEYMSPEQASLATDLDITTDVYSLGVVLYELLVGALPFDSARLRANGMLEGLRILREEEPLRPSVHIRRLGAAAVDVAQRQGCTVESLVRTLEGDLDWIVLKAIEKTRARRYGSAAELTAEVTRYLTNQPVTARTPSLSYRAAKFVRRNRTTVIAASVVAASVVMGLAVSFALYVRSQRATEDALSQRARAESRDRDAEHSAYVASITRAASSLESFDPAAAQHYLDLTDDKMRGWEWRHLLYRADPSVAVLTAYGPIPSGSFPSSFGFSNDRTTFSFNAGGSIQEWDANSYHARRARIAFPLQVLSTNSDVRFILTRRAATDGLLQILEIERGRTIATLNGIGRPIASTSFSHDGSRVGVAYESGAIWVWDAASGRKLSELKAPAPIGTLALTPDNTRLVAAGAANAPDRPGGVTLWDIGSRRRLRFFEGAGAPMVLASDGKILAATGVDKRIRVWNIARDGAPLVLEGQSSDATALAFSQDGTRLAASSSNAVRVWDLPQATLRSLIPLEKRRTPGDRATPPAGSDALSFDLDGGRLFFARDTTINNSERRAWTIRVWDLAAGLGASMFVPGAGQHSRAVRSLTFSPDGSLLAACLQNGSIVLWDVNARAVRGTLGARFVYCDRVGPAFDAEGRRIAAIGGTNVLLWDAATGEVVSSTGHHKQVVDVFAVSPTGGAVASASGKHIMIWSLPSGKVMAELDSSTRPSALAFSTDGASLFVGGGRVGGSTSLSMRRDDGSVAVVAEGPISVPPGATDRQSLVRWLWRKGVIDRSLDSTRAGAVSSIAISHDGRIALVERSGADASSDAVSVYDHSLLRRISMTAAQPASVRSLAFMDDGLRIIGGMEDGSARVWDADSGSLVFVLNHPSRSVGTRVAVSRGSSLVATAVDDTVYLWESRKPLEARALTVAKSALDRLRLPARARDEINSLRDVPSDVRSQAIDLLTRHPSDPQALVDSAWAILLRPDANADVARAALRGAEEAVRLAPWSASYVEPVALGLYRTADYDRAISVLEVSGRTETLVGQSIIAMSRWKLGQSSEARRLMREIVAPAEIANVRTLVNEARTLIKAPGN